LEFFLIGAIIKFIVLPVVAGNLPNKRSPT